MEIFHFVRETEGLADNYLYRANCFFIPKENILFIRESCGSEIVYEISSRNDILKEARSLERGEDPYKNKREHNICGLPEFSYTKRVEYDDGKIKEILRSIRDKDALEKKIELGMKELLNEI